MKSKQVALSLAILLALGTGTVLHVEAQGNPTEYSRHFGDENTVTSDHSLAVGFRNTVSGSYSTAVGQSSTASGETSLAIDEVHRQLLIILMLLVGVHEQKVKMLLQ